MKNEGVGNSLARVSVETVEIQFSNSKPVDALNRGSMNSTRKIFALRIYIFKYTNVF